MLLAAGLCSAEAQWAGALMPRQPAGIWQLLPAKPLASRKLMQSSSVAAAAGAQPEAQLLTRPHVLRFFAWFLHVSIQCRELALSVELGHSHCLLRSFESVVRTPCTFGPEPEDLCRVGVISPMA